MSETIIFERSLDRSLLASQDNNDLITLTPRVGNIRILTSVFSSMSREEVENLVLGLQKFLSTEPMDL